MHPIFHDTVKDDATYSVDQALTAGEKLPNLRSR
jgi:hypothetical protein